MSVLTDLVNAASGGLAKQVVDLAKAYFPPDMTAEQKMQFELDAQKLEADKTKLMAEATAEAEKDLNARIAMYEGTAADLKALPLVGNIIIFLRGAFRPLMAYFVGYMDFMVFSSTWEIAPNSRMEASFWIINFLVLGFYFGERAVQNIMPLVFKFLETKTNS